MPLPPPMRRPLADVTGHANYGAADLRLPGNFEELAPRVQEMVLAMAMRFTQVTGHRGVCNLVVVHAFCNELIQRVPTCYHPCSKAFSPVPPPMLQDASPSPYQMMKPQPSQESAPSASGENPLLGDWLVYKRLAVSGWEVLLGELTAGAFQPNDSLVIYLCKLLISSLRVLCCRHW